jgi:arylsulfatase
VAKDQPRVATPAHVIDLMPTILEVAGASYLEQYHGQAIQPMEGESLVPLITQSDKFNRESPLFWEHEGNRAVRSGRWKLVSLENAPWELYDINHDRGEMRDLAGERPELVAELAANWKAYAQRTKVEPYGAHRQREAKSLQKKPRQQRRRRAR